MNNVFFDGDIFGIVDNGVLAILALAGIDLDKKLGGSGVMGGLFGALIGNSLSDLLAALLDPSTRNLAAGIFAGCMYVVVIVYVYVKVTKKAL
tara:strand:+ start:196 stop:474 length:279 start_codon:yes stop_codon:yes gene_type:complete